MTAPPPVRAVVFDLGGVLIDWRREFLYDQLIDEISPDVTVTQILTDGKWRRVATSEDGVGMVPPVAV